MAKEILCYVSLMAW